MKVVLKSDAPQAQGRWWMLHRYGPSGSNFDRIIQAAPTYWCLAGPTSPLHGQRISRHRTHAAAQMKAAKIGGAVACTHELSAGADNYINELLADGMMTRPAYLSAKERPANSHAIQNGQDMEPLARRWLALEMDLEITEVSCCFSDDLRMLCSPDGMVGLRFADEAGEYTLRTPGKPAGEFSLDGDFKGEFDRVPFYNAVADAAVELKVPEPKTHIGWLRAGGVPLKHQQQCHAYFVICGVPLVKFMSFGDPTPLMVDLRPTEYTAMMAEAARAFVRRLDEARAQLLGRDLPQGATT